MTFHFRQEFKLALLVIILLAVYFQSVDNPFSRFDDPFIVEFYGVNGTQTFLNAITPGNGFYYRPLINISYWLDAYLWGLDVRFMHLENIVVHIINCLLVYLLSSHLPISKKFNTFPLLCALVFGLHPINSEPVNWIAGRTDIFAGTFILIAFYCLLQSIDKKSRWLFSLSILFSLVAVLFKETSLMFIPAAITVKLLWPSDDRKENRHSILKSPYFTATIASSIVIIFIIQYYVHIRRPGYSAISLILEGSTKNIFKAIEALGFYAKKLFIPLPLNAAIIEISPLYILVGSLSIYVLIKRFRRADIPDIFVLVSALFIIPALFVAMVPIAWTPYGERYLYIPSAFAVIGCLDLLLRCKRTKWFMPCVSSVIALSFFITFQRGILWGDNLILLEDIIAKSPHFGVARNEYGILLKNAGRYEEALTQFKTALHQTNQANVTRMVRLNLFSMELLGKEPDEARNLLIAKIGNKSEGDVELLKLLNRFDEALLNEVNATAPRKRLVTGMIETNEILYLKLREPHYLYRAGQLSLAIGDQQKAAHFFTEAWKNAPLDAYYRESARRLADKLVKE